MDLAVCIIRIKLRVDLAKVFLPRTKNKKASPDGKGFFNFIGVALISCRISRNAF